MPLVAALGLWCGDKLTENPKKGLSVLALVTDAFGSHGGIARYNQDLLSALALSSRVGDILVVPRHGASPKEGLPERVNQTPPRSGRISYAAHVLAAVARKSFDVVFCGHLYMSPLATLISETLKKPMWLQLHGIEAWERPGRLVRAAAERATLVTAVSRYTRHRFLEWANVPPERVRVLPNTFKPQFAAGPKRDDLAERHNLRGRRVLLTVSRLAASERYKGHDRVISVLPRVLERIPDVAYLVVGDGDDRQRLEELAQRRVSRMRCVLPGMSPIRSCLTTFVSLTFSSCRAQARVLASCFSKLRLRVSLLSAEIVMAASMRWPMGLLALS